MAQWPYHPFGVSVATPTSVERDVVEKPSVPDYLLDIHKLMSTTYPAVSMFQNPSSAVVYFDKAMICVKPDGISGFVSADARGKYDKPDDDFIKWNDTCNGPCFRVSVLNREDAGRAEQEINMLLCLHFAGV
jgi:hypothetical protein